MVKKTVKGEYPYNLILAITITQNVKIIGDGARVLANLIKELTEKERYVIASRFEREETLAVAGEKIERSGTTIWMNEHRALRKLRDPRRCERLYPYLLLNSDAEETRATRYTLKSKSYYLEKLYMVEIITRVIAGEDTENNRAYVLEQANNIGLCRDYFIVTAESVSIENYVI